MADFTLSPWCINGENSLFGRKHKCPIVWLFSLCSLELNKLVIQTDSFLTTFQISFVLVDAIICSPRKTPEKEMASSPGEKSPVNTEGWECKFWSKKPRRGQSQEPNCGLSSSFPMPCCLLRDLVVTVCWWTDLKDKFLSSSFHFQGHRLKVSFVNCKTSSFNFRLVGGGNVAAIASPTARRPARFGFCLHGPFLLIAVLVVLLGQLWRWLSITGQLGQSNSYSGFRFSLANPASLGWLLSLLSPVPLPLPLILYSFSSCLTCCQFPYWIFCFSPFL